MPEPSAEERPLPGAPDPWTPSAMPTLRSGPPYHMTEMIAAEPALAERLVHRLALDPAMSQVAELATAAASAAQPITVTGCGTSEHAAMAAAALVADALGPERGPLVRARQALDAARDPQRAGLVIAVSHEGGTTATIRAVSAGRAAGAHTALVTVSARSKGAAEAELVIETGEQDQSWCHTVGYISPVVVASSLWAHIRGRPLDGTALRALLAIGLEEGSAATEVAAVLAACPRLIVAGAGIDQAAARELALKIEEGAGIPSLALHLESVRHGHLGAADPTTGMVVILTDAEPAGELVRERARAALRSARALGMPAAAILGARIGTAIPLDLTRAGRLTAPEANAIGPLAESILGSAIPLQLLALELAMARGRNPDAIGRDEPLHAAAAHA